MLNNSLGIEREARGWNAASLESLKTVRFYDIIRLFKYEVTAVNGE